MPLQRLKKLRRRRKLSQEHPAIRLGEYDIEELPQGNPASSNMAGERITL